MRRRCERSSAATSSAPATSLRRRITTCYPGESSSQPLSSISAPTLVIHGTADPMFPLEHGEALAEEIPGARLLRLEDAGHGVERADWQRIVRAILGAHTGHKIARAMSFATANGLYWSTR